MQKIRKILRVVSEKISLPTNQLLPTTLIFVGPRWRRSISIKQITGARKCNINRYLVWVNKRLLWITRQQYRRSQDLPSALVPMDNVFSELESFKLPCYLTISGNCYEIIITWIIFQDCQGSSTNLLFFTSLDVCFQRN